MASEVLIGQQSYVVLDLLLGLGDHVRRGGNQQVEPGLLRVVGEREHLLVGGVGDVRADGPVAAGLVGHHVEHAHPLLAGQAPELAHAPGAAAAVCAKLPDVPDVAAQPLLVQLIVRREGRHQGGPLSAEVFARPVQGLVLGVLGHVVSLPACSALWFVLCDSPGLASGIRARLDPRGSVPRTVHHSQRERALSMIRRGIGGGCGSPAGGTARAGVGGCGRDKSCLWVRFSEKCVSFWDILCHFVAGRLGGAVRLEGLGSTDLGGRAAKRGRNGTVRREVAIDASSPPS